MAKEIEIMNKNNAKLTESALNEDDTSELLIELLPKNFTKYDKSIKIILLGDSGVGKTSLLNCLEEKGTEKEQNNTISLEYYNYNIKINNYAIRMQIWDTVGLEKFNSIMANYYKTADVVIIIYAINDINSFNNVNNWLNELNDKSNNNIEIEEKKMIKILVGNKKDLINERKVTYEMGEKMKKDKNFFLFEEINCDKINKNSNEKDKKNEKECIKNLFFNIGKIIYKEYIQNKVSRTDTSVYVYEASNSILEISQDYQDSSNFGGKSHKSCGC